MTAMKAVAIVILYLDLPGATFRATTTSVVSLPEPAQTESCKRMPHQV
jgi:hypothetical protein